jgi:hypothetical protein
LWGLASTTISFGIIFLDAKPVSAISLPQKSEFCIISETGIWSPDGLEGRISRILGGFKPALRLQAKAEASKTGKRVWKPFFKVACYLL